MQLNVYISKGSAKTDGYVSYTKLSLKRALCFKEFKQVQESDFDDFLKRQFDSIFDFRKTQNSNQVPTEHCREFLNLSPVILTLLINNLHTQILESCSLKFSILRTQALTG